MKSSLSPGSVIFLILVLTCAVANTVHSNPLLFLAGTLFCPLLWNFAAPWFVLRKTSVMRRLPEFTFAKEETPCEIELISRSRVGLACCVADPFPGTAVIFRLLKVHEFRLKKRELCRSLHYSLEFRRRGVYELSEFDLSCSYPFGLFSFVRRFGADENTLERKTITVFPERIDVQEFWDRLAALSSASGNRYSGEGWAGLKVWMEGEGFRRIHWRASVRHGMLLSRKNEAAIPLAALVIMDLTDTDCRNAEKSISLTGTVVYELCNRFAPQTFGAPVVIWVRIIAGDGIELIKSEETEDFCRTVLEKLATASQRDPSLAKVGSDDVIEQFRERYSGAVIFQIGAEM